VKVLRVCAFALALLAAGCNRFEPVPGMEQLPKELAPYARKIAESKMPHVSVTPVKGSTNPWDSKLRGVPYFPKDKNWPVDRDGMPLVMLVQINFAEMPKLEGYPTEGILQLYISSGYDDTHGWGMRIDGAHKTELGRLTDRSYFRAVYFPTVSHDATNLITETPEVEFSEEYGFPVEHEARLTFKLESGYVRPEDYRFRRVFGKDREKFFDYRNPALDDVEGDYEAFNGAYRYLARIGGYSRVEQQDPRLDFPNEDWIVLFSLDTFSTPDYSVQWADDGIGNFYIRPRDLAKRDFSRVMYYWDCG